MNKPQKLDGKICFRLLLLAQFMQANGEWGFSGGSMVRGLPKAYKFAISSGISLRREILAVYRDDARQELNYQMDKDRIKDISLLLDELVDADNIEELTELIKANKKTT